MRTLYHWPLDPWSRQARIALAEKQLAFELRFERPWDAPDELLALNPAGLTPVLVDDTPHGRVVAVEARAILEYLEEAKPEAKPTPAQPN